MTTRKQENKTMPKQSPSFDVCLWVRSRVLVGTALLLLLVVSRPVSAQAIEESHPFTLDEWIEIDQEREPITIHRFRLIRSKGGLTSRVTGEDRYSQPLELELEFTNDSSTDWHARIELEWSDADGTTIDGIETKFELDEGEQRDIRKERRSANRYGLEHARNLSLRIALEPD
jgi:hypothetical protein